MFEVLEMAEKMGFGVDKQGSWGLMITLNYVREPRKHSYSTLLYSTVFGYGFPLTKSGASLRALSTACGDAGELRTVCGVLFWRRGHKRGAHADRKRSHRAV